MPATPEQPVVENAVQETTKSAPKRLKPLGKRVFQVPVKGKYVALTFDDGPHAELTPKALDILARHGAKGTFFMLGQNVARYKSVVRRAAAEGHEIGVHTWSHIKMNSSARARVDREVSRTQNLIADVTGVVPRVMRPPYGATNKTLVNHMYSSYGMASIMWDVDTLDWRKPGVSKVVSTAVEKARPGSIILVHDIHATTLAALEKIVTGLQERGFKLVTVSELMQIAKREAAGETEVPAQPADAPAADGLPSGAEPLAEPAVEVQSEEPVAAPAAPAPVAPQPAVESETAQNIEHSTQN